MTAVSSEGAPDRRTGRTPMILYTVSFVLLLAALGSLLVAVRGFLSELWPLWLSSALSVAAIVFAFAGALTGRRRAGAEAEES